MADHGKDDFRADVKKAVDAGSDLSQGGEHAYKNLMAELAKDQAKYAKDPAKFDQLGKAVADGLAANNVIDSHMLRWSRDNMSRFSTGDNGEVKAIEMDPSAPGNAGHLNGFETAMMSRFQQTYAQLQHDAPKTFWGNDKDAFSQKDFSALIAQREKPIQEAADNRQQNDLALRKDAQRSEVTAALLRNDGDSRHSLAAVLDNIRGGKPDGEISRSDVRQFIANYPAGSSRGDFGYNDANLKAAQLLDAQWDNALGTSLRGQYKDNMGGHSDQMRTHDRIDLNRLAQMNNFQSADAMAAAYGPGGAPDGRALRSVSASQPDAAVVPQVAGDGNTALRPVRQDANVLVSGDGQPVLDGSGNPVRTGSGDLPPRPVRQSNQMPDDASVDPAAGNAPRPVRHYRERHANTRGIRQPVDGTDPNATDAAGLPPRPVRPNADANAGDASAPRPIRQDVQSRPAVAGKDPNDVPELQAPDIKLDGDLAKQRADFQKQVGDYLSAKSQYTPTPGQGWDRIARDLMRRAGGDDWKNEVQVESLSDQIAKLNGRDGRLDGNGRPRLGEPVRVLSDDQVKAANDELMKRFDAKVEEMKGAAPKDGATDPQLFDDKRNAIPAPADKAAAPAAPADKAAAPAAPADKAAAPAAPADKAAAPVAPADKAAAPAAAASDAAAARSIDQPVPAKPAPPAYTGDAGKPAAAASSDAARVQADLKGSKQVGVADIASPNADDGVAPTSAREAELARQQAAKDKAAKDKAAKEAASSGLGLDTDSWTVG